MNRTDTSKGNKTPLDATGITSLLRNTFYVLVPVPPNCCLHLAEPNSCCLGEAPLQLPLAGCSSWASSHCTAQRPVARLLLLPLVSAGRDAAPREHTHPLCCFTLGSLYTRGNKTSRRCRVPRVRNNGAIGGFAGTHYKMLMEMLFKELLAFS